MFRQALVSVNSASSAWSSRSASLPATAKICATIDAMVRGNVKTIAAAAEPAGLSREHPSRELGRPHIAKLLEEKVVRNLALSSARAGATKIDIRASANDMVRDRASSWLLELAGHSPNPAAGNHRGGGPRAGWTIDLSEPTQPALVIVVNHPPPPAPKADQTGVVIDATPNPS